MKKWISFIMILFLAFIFVGCGENPENSDYGNDDGNGVKPTSVEVTGIVDGQEMEIGDALELEIKVLPDNATNKKYRVKASDTSILKVEDNKITALSSGETTVTVQATANPSAKKEFKVVVKGGATVEVAPTKITLSGGTEVQVGRPLLLTVSVEPEGASKSVVWSSSDTSKATVNASGQIVGVAEGEVIIKAVSKLDESVVVEYKVTVIPKEVITPVIVEPTSIEITFSSEEVEEGYSITARATVLPNGADQSVIWSSSDENVATIDEAGKITAKKKGKTYIRATTPDGKVKSKLKLITVTEAVPPQPAANLQGYTIELMNADSGLASYDPFLEGYNGQDKVYKQKAWREIEKEFNCTISVVAYPSSAPWGSDRINWLVTQAELGKAQADFAVWPSSWLVNATEANAATDAKAYYNKYGKNQMDITQKQSATYKGGLYALSTGIDETRIYADLGLYYYVDKVEELGVESPAKMFNEGRWTYSNFITWAKDVQAALKGDDEYALCGNLYYWWLGMTNTTGVIVGDVKQVKVTLSDARQKAAAEVLQELALAGALSTTSEWQESSGEFIDQKAVMTSGSWWFVKASNRWPAQVDGKTMKYGYVPFPYPDDMTKDQIRVAEYGSTILLFLSQREWNHPAGVTYEGIYQAMTELYLRSNQYFKADPSYDATSYKYNSIVSKIDDPESVTAAMYWDESKVFYDAAHDFYVSPSGSKLQSKITSIVKGSSYQQTMDSLDSTYVADFISIYSAG